MTAPAPGRRVDLDSLTAVETLLSRYDLDAERHAMWEPGGVILIGVKRAEDSTEAAADEAEYPQMLVSG